MRTAAAVDLPLALDRDDPRPLPRQLADALRDTITRGVLAPGEAVPSTRALAQHLGVSRGTVVAAYEQLVAEGYLAALRGGRTVVEPALRRVHPGPPPPPARRPSSPLPGSSHRSIDAIDLRPGRPWQASLANAAWRAAWREAARHPDDPGSLLGVPELRAEVADHLRRMRGVVRPPGDVVVTAGAREGLSLLLAALGLPRRVGVEEPGYPSLRRVPARLGASVVGLAVDRDGLVTAALPTRDVPEVVLVTPSHQHPLGGSLPVARRQELLAWASAHGVWVVEDDYDSELRYTSEPLPALAALDTHGRVITLGTFATTLAPGVGVGFLLAPPGLVPALAATRADLGQPVSVVTQRALAAYLASGELRRHTHRMRALYRRRRAEVAAAFGARGVRVSPMDGGLHCVVETTRPEADVVADAAAHGVLVAGLSTYWTGGPAHDGVVFGFGAVDEDALRRGLDVLAEACAGGAHGPRRSSG